MTAASAFMNSSTMESPSPATKMKKRGSWDLLAGMAADMVSSLELGDDDGYGAAFYPTSKTERRPSLPAIQDSYVSMTVPMRDRNSAINLKAQARQQKQTRPQKLFSSLAPTLHRKNQAKKDPLQEFHEKHNKAHVEYKKQEAKKRRQQIREYDDEKSVVSSNSFFDFLTRSGAADELLDDVISRDGDIDGLSRCGSRASTGSFTSYLGLFGDDEDEIAKLSSTKPERNAEKETKEAPTLQAAVKESKSVRGHRVYARGRQAAENGDWKKAVAYYHIALVKQRKHYGEDHIVTSNTLNSLGLALMHLGEHFGALTALEEALHIRQELLGAGAEEVAETTSNIWMVLKASQEET
ncbi:hypothetical protein ACHAXR_001757 [Thalassiosira sp. AJA248-18]